MFFDRKKTDSKIRWQKPQFRSRLQAARSYKRPTIAKPSTKGAVFLSKVGLGSWPARLACGAILILLVYLVYIPNVFFIKKISFQGAPDKLIEKVTNEYLSKKTPWPQKNLLLMSKNGLNNFIISHDQQILRVDKINKKLPGGLEIFYIQRVDEYLLQTASSSYFSLSSDGLITGEIFKSASGTLPSNLVTILLGQTPNISLGQQLLTANQASFLNALQKRLAQIAKNPVDRYEIADLQGDALQAYIKQGFLVKFDMSTNAEEILNRLNLLVTQLAPGEFKNLLYVDMRFKDRAYVCYKNTACANNAVVPTSAATGTITNLINQAN